MRKLEWRIRLAPGALLLGATMFLESMSPSLAGLKKVDNVAFETLVQAGKAAVATLKELGQPVSDPDRARLLAAFKMSGHQGIGEIQDVLDRYCLLEIYINEEGWLSAIAASDDPADRLLIQSKWKAFLVKVYNESAVKAPIGVRSAQELLPDELKDAEEQASDRFEKADSWYRWIGLKTVQDAVAIQDLPGNSVHYLVLYIFSRDQGMRAADLEFYFSGGAVSQGHYVRKQLLFNTAPAASAAGR